MENMVDIVDKIGFNALMLLLCGYFIKYMFDRFMSELTSEKEAHREEVEKLSDVIKNNTVAITELSSILKERQS